MGPDINQQQQQFILPDGSFVGTGLQTPPTNTSSMVAYASVGPMLSMEDIITAARSGHFNGANSFDKSFVKNQQNHGSCNGFAEAAALTRARIRRLGIKYRVDLSGAYAYSLINGGRDQGSMLEDGMKMSQVRGICREEYCKWNQIYPSQYDKAKCDADAKNHIAFECYAVTTETELFSGLVNGFDAVVAVHADNGFMNLDSRGVAGGGNGGGNHAVICDGARWDEGTRELIGTGVNSWGLSYGDNGRMGLTWKRHFAPTIRNHVFYLMRSTEDVQEGDTIPTAQT